MNQDEFARLLETPAEVDQYTYKEIKDLCMEHPACQSLRVLLALKSKRENHPHFQEDLYMAAAYSHKRGLLYRLLHQNPVESIVEEDILQLMDLEKLQTQLPTDATEKPKSLEVNPPPVEPDEGETIEETLDRIFEEAVAEEQQMAPGSMEADSFQSAIDWSSIVDEDTTMLERLQEESRPQDDWTRLLEKVVKDAAVVSQLLALRDSPQEQEEVKPTAVVKSSPGTTDLPKPEPKTSFSSWLKKFSAPQPVGESLKKEIPQKEEGVWNFKAQMSVTESQDIASETLAGILEKQEQYGKAIEIYERLKLKMPEKSSFFAQKIQELKDKL